MAQLSLSFFGSWRVLLGNETIPRFKYDKVRALLAFLVVEPSRPHRRETLMDMFWPDLPETAARNNLRQALVTLREAIGDRQADPAYLLVDRASVQINSNSQYTLDVDEFTNLLDSVSKHVHRRPESCRHCLQLMKQAASLYRGPLLADFYLSDSTAFEEWATLKREWLHQQALGLLGRLTATYEQKGEFKLALQYVWRLLDLDLWREEAHRQAMRLYLLSGDREAALAQYEKCRRVLSDEIGVDPEPETTHLYEHIRRGETWPSPSSSSSPPTKDAPSPLGLPVVLPHNLPPLVTPFLGREKELTEIGGLLDETYCRLITLIGPGGSGKTRLAVQAAAEHIDSFRDGVFFVSLTPLQSAALFPATITTAIQMELAPNADPSQQLLTYLRKKEMLLVLDSFEHLMDATAFLAKLLKHAPEIVVLVTSRERLNLQGETVFPVEGLPVPTALDSLEMLSQNTAVQLFVQSARRVHRTFSLTSDNCNHVASICTLTAGLPLAIELAAAWVRALSCREITEEIAGGIGFLTTNLRDIPERHRSLAAVFDHSWQLLSSEEQRVLGGLSVFQGGFSRLSGEAVAGATPTSLAALVDKSLLRRNQTGRYEIHEMIRQYAQEKLAAAGDLVDIRFRHADYLLALAQEAEPKLVGPEQAEWLVRLQEENENIRYALHSSLEDGKSETAGRIAGAIWRFWQTSGQVSEGRTWLERILKAFEDSHAEHGQNRIDAGVRAGVHKAAGVMAWLQGDYARSKACFETGLSLYQQAGDRAGVAILYGNMGALATHRTDYQEARTLLMKALELRRELGDRWGVASALNNLGALAGRLGDILQAQAYYQECLAIFSELGYQSGIALSLSNLGSAAGDLGDYDRAYNLHIEGLAIRRQLGDKPGTANSLSDLGNLAYRKGDIDQACVYYAESLGLLQELGDKEHIFDCLEGMAQVASAQGLIENAARIWGAVEALRVAINVPMSQSSLASYQEDVSSARLRLEPETWSAAWGMGRRMTLEHTIASTLELANKRVNLNSVS
jgi:predicted ATPase/DNA-binding SARP family transcriptional activator